MLCLQCGLIHVYGGRDLYLLLVADHLFSVSSQLLTASVFIHSKMQHMAGKFCSFSNVCLKTTVLNTYTEEGEHLWQQLVSISDNIKNITQKCL